MPTDVLAPKQQRSRETLTRLLRATLEILDAHGLSGATIPRIAAAAGVAPASVYRRFRDKNALYRAAFLAALEQSVAANRESLKLSSLMESTLEGVVNLVASATIVQFRTHPGLMRALIRFIEDDSDESFKKNTIAMIAQNFKLLIDLALTFQNQIMHPNPRRAVTFGLLSLVSTIEERTLALEHVSLWHELLPISDQELHTEVTRSLLAYLTSPQRETTN